MDSRTLNLDNLLVHLRAEVSSCWYQFGLAMQLEKEILDTIAKTCSATECIVEMLDFWLKNHIGKPSWREVVGALKAIDCMKLALDIEKVYDTGIIYNYS